MKATFLGQPFPDADQIGTVVTRALRDDGRHTAWFATAWAKRSGLSRMADEIAAFRTRGGRAEAIVGIDEGGATIEGLQLALEVFDQAYVFHDPGTRTFHPKFYVVEGDAAATAVVGSGNLTRGGLFTNYETAIVADLDLTDSDDADFLAGVRAYFTALRALKAVCKPLTADLIDALKADPNVLVGTEQQANAQRARQRQSGGVFGDTPVPGLRNAPPADLTTVHPRRQDNGLPVLVAEIPRNAPKRTQLDVGVEHFEGFFGGIIGRQESARLQHVDGDGRRGEVEQRKLFRTSSGNYRLEAGAGTGREYPGNPRPLGVFVRMPDGLITYRLLWPQEPDYADVDDLLTARAGPRHPTSIRRAMTTTVVLVAAWRAGALLLPR